VLVRAFCPQRLTCRTVPPSSVRDFPACLLHGQDKTRCSSVPSARNASPVEPFHPRRRTAIPTATTAATLAEMSVRSDSHAGRRRADIMLKRIVGEGIGRVRVLCFRFERDD